MTNSRKYIALRLVLIPDILLFYAGLWLAVAVRYQGGLSREGLLAHFSAFTPVFAAWLLVFFIHGLFDASSLRRYAKIAANLASAMAVNTLIAVLYFYFQPNLILTPRRLLLVQVAVTFLLVLAWHLALKYFFKNRLAENLYLFSFNNELAELEQEIRNHGYLGFRVLGHLNENNLSKTVFGKDTGVVLPDSLAARPEILGKFYELRKQGVSFYNHKKFYEELTRRVYLSQLNEAWFLENINYKEKRFYNLAKRLMDLLSGFVFFLAFLLSYPVLGALIKLGSKGPVLFVQERVGKDGKAFLMYKFRTMSGGPTNTWTEANDPRITPLGKWLRKTRIDELPQSINLLLGNISLVGPRPEQVHIVEELRSQIPFYDERHLVKPGITGWAQLNIYAASLEETKSKLQYDLYYIKHRGLLLDFEIILKTIYYIFTWQGR